MCNNYKYLYIIKSGDIQVKYYYTNYYQSYKGQTRNIIYILNEEERLYLTDAIKQLLDDRDTLVERGFIEYHYTKQGTLSKRSKPHPVYLKKYWSDKDEQAIQFLQRLCFFGEFENSIMLDPTDYQLEGMVDKMLFKIYGAAGAKFAYWLELELEGELTKDQLRTHMDYKRDLFKRFKEAGMAGNITSLPY